MADKPIKLGTTGQLTEFAPITTSGGAGDAGKVLATDGGGKIDSTFLPSGIGADTKLITASEALSAGDFVNIWTSTGVKVRKADASASGKRAHGFVLSAVSSSGTATVYASGINNAVSGATPGADAFLSDSAAGGFVATAPSGSGKVVQYIGPVLSATEIAFEPTIPVVLA